MDKTITIQQAAAQLLAEHKKPLKSKDLARLAQERKLVAPSAAKDPIQSLSQVIERNIRLDKGNKPRLVFVETSAGRCIALPAWYEKKKVEEVEKKEVVSQKVEKVEIGIPVDILNKVQLYQTSFKLPSIEAAIVQLTKKGLGATADDLIERLKVELEGL
nr:HTH domain-containing protein [uncultured Cellulosilyticum sp.]